MSTDSPQPEESAPEERWWLLAQVPATSPGAQSGLEIQRQLTADELSQARSANALLNRLSSVVPYARMVDLYNEVEFVRSAKASSTRIALDMNRAARALGVIAAGFPARIRTRSVSLGGNGQFTRLSALRSVGATPWSDALTEDLDLGVELTLRGWELDCAANSWVSQQGVETVRALLRQRTRWYQGHMICARKAMALWRSPLVPRRTALETTLYLITPCFVMLPWSIAFTLGLGYFAYQVVHHTVMPFDGVGVQAVFYAGFWYLLTFLPPVILGLLYAQRSDHEHRLAAIGKGHVHVFYAYLNMAAGWRALARIALRRHGWAKKARVAEPDAAAPLRRAA
jgi:hypothetical protein